MNTCSLNKENVSMSLILAPCGHLKLRMHNCAHMMKMLESLVYENFQLCFQFNAYFI